MADGVELPCGCPDASHNSSRRTRAFTDEAPEVPLVRIVNGHPFWGLDNRPPGTDGEAGYWKAVAEMYKVRYEATRDASVRTKDKLAKLTKKVERLERKLRVPE